MKFHIGIVNERGDGDKLFAFLTAKSVSGLEGIELDHSTSLKSLPASISMDTIDAGRLHVGYGEFTGHPVPDGDQYYGWVEFSRLDDTTIWINLSNVDLLALPLTLAGHAGGKPFQLGYRSSKDAIVARLENEKIAGDTARIVCASGQEKILGPNVRSGAFGSFDSYLDSLKQAGAPLAITSDVAGGIRKTFHGHFQNTDPIIDLKSDQGDTLQVDASQFTSDLIYRGDGGTIRYNGHEVAQNQSPQDSSDKVFSNSVYRNLVIGMNEGYFLPDGRNASADFGGMRPFQSGKGNQYARILHEESNSYGFPYADSNLKVLIQADPDTPIQLTILGDGTAKDFDDTPSSNQPQFGDWQFGIGAGSQELGMISIAGWRYLPTAAGAYGGFLPTVEDWTPMHFSRPGKTPELIWFRTTGDGGVEAEGCFTTGAPQFHDRKLIWGAGVDWVEGHPSPPKPE